MTNGLTEVLAGQPALLQGINTTYALLVVGCGWATHANWPRIIAAGTWIVEHGGVAGIARRVLAGRRTSNSQPRTSNDEPGR